MSIQGIYSECEALGSSKFISTTVVAPVAPKDEDLKAIPVREVIARPTDCTDAEWSVLMNAFLRAKKPVAMVDCQAAEVLTVETYQIHQVPATIVDTPGDLPLDNADHRTVYNSACALVNLSTGGGANLTDFCGSLSAWTKHVHVVNCSGVRPTKIPLDAAEPFVEIERANGAPVAVYKTWAWVTSDPTASSSSVVGVSGAQVGELGAVTIFRTIGKIIKVVSQVAGIVLPFLDEFLGYKDAEPWVKVLNTRMNRSLQKGKFAATGSKTQVKRLKSKPAAAAKPKKAKK